MKFVNIHTNTTHTSNACLRVEKDKAASHEQR